jgi:hypothetical protein
MNVMKKSPPVFAIAMTEERKCRNLTAEVVLAACSLCVALVYVL